MRTKELFSQKAMKSRVEERHLIDIEVPEKIKQSRKKFIEKNQLYLLPEFDMSMGITPVSASKLTTYLGCKYGFLQDYIEHIKRLMSIPKAFGGTVHQTLEYFWKNRPNLEEFIDRGIKNWNRTVHSGRVKIDLKKEYGIVVNGRKDIKDILTKFYEKNCNAPEPLKIGDKLMVEYRFNVDYKGFRFIGIFDKVDMINGEIFISDYKTDKIIPPNIYIENNYQFTIYDLAFNLLFSKKVSAIKYYHLRTGIELPTQRTGVHIDDLMYEVRKADEGIKNKDFRHFIGFHCKSCHHSEDCKKKRTPEEAKRIEEIVASDIEKYKNWQPERGYFNLQKAN